MSISECIHKFFDDLARLDVDDGNGNFGFNREFKEIVGKSRKWIYDNVYPAEAGENPANVTKNRYKDILPFDHSRVILPTQNGVEHSDYINANYIMGASGKRSYIASQGPQPATVNDFWRMLCHFKINVVIMACNEYEGIKFKCQKYWPEKDQTIYFCDDTIAVSLVEVQEHGEYAVRVLQVKREDKIRLIYHLHYGAWPDHGIPTAIEPILDMLAYARQYQVKHTTPIVVHCSAGCGRTGTVIALDYTWSLLKSGKLTLDYSIYDMILNFRTQRPSLVQTEDQYLFVYLAVKELFDRHLSLLENNLYENVVIPKVRRVSSNAVEEDSNDQNAQLNPEHKDDTRNNDIARSKPSSSSTPDYNKTPEVPTLKPLPGGPAPTTGTASKQPPPKAQRVFRTGATGSPTDATIRETLSRLGSTGSDTRQQSSTPNSIYNQPGISAKPTSLPLKPNSSKAHRIISPTSAEKPELSPKPNKASLSNPAEQATSTKRSSVVQRNRIPAVAGSSDKSSSLDDLNDSKSRSRRLGSSTSDSSSVNTVFTSDKGSPSAISDISVFSSENVAVCESVSAPSHDYDNLASDDIKRKAVSLPKNEFTPVKPDKPRGQTNSKSISTPKTDDLADAYETVENVAFLRKCSAPANQQADNIQRNNKAHNKANNRNVSADNMYSEATGTDTNPRNHHHSLGAVTSEKKYVRKERLYDEVVFNDDGGGDKPVDHGPDEAYAYTGNSDGTKWSLQNIALGLSSAPEEARNDNLPSSAATHKPSQSMTSSAASAPPSEYSEATATGETYDMCCSSDEEGAPKLPDKQYEYSLASEINASFGDYPVPARQPASSSTIGRIIGKKFKSMTLASKKDVKSEGSGISHVSQPAAVTYKGKNISYGLRVGKPKGLRQNTEISDSSPYVA